jgi:hypothetical protein
LVGEIQEIRDAPEAFNAAVGNSALKRFEARFSRYGFSDHNTADSFAGLTIAAWETINDQNASAHLAGIRQFRARANEVMAKGYTGTSDALKQHDSEYYKVLAMVYTDAANWQKSHNDLLWDSGRDLTGKSVIQRRERLVEIIIPVARIQVGGTSRIAGSIFIGWLKSAV